jgi:hypothetical protein
MYKDTPPGQSLSAAAEGVPRQMNEVNLLSLPDGRQGGVVESNFKIHHPVTCLRQASSFVCTFGANSLMPPLLSRRGVLLTRPKKVYRLID